jgi:hypothetical protein
MHGIFFGLNPLLKAVQLENRIVDHFTQRFVSIILIGNVCTLITKIDSATVVCLPRLKLENIFNS